MDEGCSRLVKRKMLFLSSRLFCNIILKKKKVYFKNSYIFIVSLLSLFSPLILKISIHHYYLKEHSMVDFFIDINYKNINLVCFFLSKSLLFFYEQLINITCIDNLTISSTKETLPRFTLVYLLNCINTTSRVLLTYSVGVDNLLFSLSSIYKNALWLEREIFDLFGLFFFFHNDLRRILTDYGFKGFPLRKDFPLTGYIELRFKESVKTLVYSKIKLIQEYRYFSFNNQIKHNSLI